MDLKEAKEKIKVVSIDEQLNEKLTAWLRDPDDCFGRGYSDGNKYCKECNIAVDVDGRVEQVNVLCKEFLTDGTEDGVKEKSKLQTKLELLKALRERKEEDGNRNKRFNEK